jgi:polyferredoxin
MIVKLDLKPSSRQLQQFGWFALIAFSALGALAFFRGSLFGMALGAAAKPLAYGLWGLAAASALFSLLAPAANRPLFILLSLVAFPIGLVVSHVVLGFLFFGILTPLGLFFRLIGRDRLERRFEPQRESYWVDAAPARKPEDYFRQF